MATLKDILPQIPQDELAILRDLNSKLDESKLTEATAKEAAQAVKEIIKGWKGWSQAMLAAMLLTPNIANALETYSPDTLNAIRTEISGEKSSETKGNPTAVKTEDFSQTFASGQSQIVNKQVILTKVNDLKKWISNNKTKPFKLVITASESQVPNPEGFKKGELAQERGESLKAVVDNLGATDVEIKTLVGGPAWDGKNKDDAKYTKHQYVKVSIVIDTESICSLSKISKEGEQGNSANNFRTYDEYLNGDGNITLHTGTIPDRMVVLDENDRITHDTGYVATDKTDAASGYQEWNFVPIYVLKLTKLVNNKTVMGSKIQYVDMNGVKSFEDLKNKMLKVPGQNKDKSDNIDKALDELELMYNKGVRKFVSYQVGTGDLKVEFKNSSGDSKVQIFSPVGKTGFDLTGQCTRQ
jgi:hypothetical protein